jgi:hypothetical protein
MISTMTFSAIYFLSVGASSLPKLNEKTSKVNAANAEKAR